MKLENDNDQLMATAAHRYCLGRASYIVPVCIEWLRQVWPQLNKNTQNIIVRDTAEAIMRGEAGHQCDETNWLDFGGWAYDQLDQKSQDWVLHATKHIDATFPFGDK